MIQQPSLDDLRAALTGDIAALARNLLGGEPTIARGRKWRYGRKFSLAVDVGGAKQGMWFDFEAGTGGGPFELIMQAKNCSFPEAVAWARAWTGGHRPEPVTPTRTHVDDAAERAERIALAQRTWAESGSPASTPAEIYLTGRGIPRPDAGWPDAVRFHAPSCSLIVAATTSTGDVQAVQRVRLTAAGGKHPSAPIARGAAPGVLKPTNGPQDGALVRLPGDTAGPLVLSEGPETGLSVWTATKYETWVALGSVAKAEPPAGRIVVIARDDDRDHCPADKQLRRAVKTWEASGITVAVASPWAERRNDKSDFNDLIQQGGPEAVRARIEAAIAPFAPATKRHALADARSALNDAVHNFAAAAEDYAIRYDPADPKRAPPAMPVHAIGVGLGIGKSRAARNTVAMMLALRRARGDKSTIAFAVPTHALADEAAREFEAEPIAREAGLTAAIWRGRTAADPADPDERMCRDLDRVKDAQEAGQDVQTSCCAAKPREGETAVQCPFYATCGYQKQRRMRADVWFVAHEMMFTGKPAAVGDLAAVIVDETAWQDGLEGHAKPIELTVDTLAGDSAVAGDPMASQRLRFLRGLAMRALGTLNDGPVRREALIETGMLSGSAAEARALEWRRKVDAEMHPGMTRAERKAAMEAAAGNRTIARLALFWKAVEALVADGGPEASGWAALASVELPEGRARVLHLKGRKPVREGWQVPTLLLDATMNVDLVRPFWPTVELTAEVEAETPHQRTYQVVDRSFSKRHLDLRDDLAPDERRRRLRHVRDLNATLATLGRRHAPGRTLVVAQKAVREALADPEIGRLPPSIVLAHHNAVAGRDEWRDVRALTVVGRTAPPPGAVTRMAEALTGASVPLLESWYPKADAAREMADGRIVPAEADRHPDPICEAIRWRVCEGELLQIIGRARGVNRSEADPVSVFVLTDTPLPIPLDGTLSAADLDPSPAEMMLGMDGMAFENPTDAA